MTSQNIPQNFGISRINYPFKGIPKVSGFIAQLVRASHLYREVMVQTPLKS